VTLRRKQIKEEVWTKSVISERYYASEPSNCSTTSFYSAKIRRNTPGDVRKIEELLEGHTVSS
jgi:predicted nucleic-acid-binding Zn-ribbon protein